MLAAPLALLGALIYGAADFLGGLAARRLRSAVVTATAAAAGLVVLLPALLLAGSTWQLADLLWGALSGITGAVAIGLLYACLALGPMSILSPITAVVSAIAPMLWGLLVRGEELSPLGYLGLAFALVAIVLVAFLPGERITRPSLRGILMAVGSGAGIGAFLIIIDQTSTDSGVLPLVANRSVSALIMTGVAVAVAVSAVRRGTSARSALTIADEARPHPGPTPSGRADLEHAAAAATRVAVTTPRAWTLAIACGLVDAIANLVLLLALRSGGDLAVVSALTALYPAGTVLLASVVLGERIARVQWVGLVLALLAGVLLAVT